MGEPPVVLLGRHQAKNKRRIASEPIRAHPLGSFGAFFSSVFVDVPATALAPVSFGAVDFSTAVGVEGASCLAASLYESLR